MNGGEEAASRTRANAATRDGNRQMRLACAGSANQHDIALLRDESAAGEIANEILIDWGVREREGVDVFGQWQFADRKLVFARPGLFLRYLGLEQIADEVLRLVLALERGCQRLVVGALHSVEVPVAPHSVE